MSAALAAPPAHAAAPKAAAAARPALRLVQRSCDCGGPPGLSGRCDGCARTGLRPGAAVDGEIAPPLVQQALAAPGQALDAAARAAMEARLGHDFSRVRIHDGKLADAAARAVGANAYTVGQDVVFRAGLYRPGTAAGDALLAHELTHAAQQAQAAPAARLRIGPADDGHERAARAAAAAPVAAAAPARVRRQVVQREEAQGAAPAADDGFVTGKALNFFAEQANMIPGFRMLTIVLGVNPINMSKVAPTPGNILRALVEFMPGGGIIVQALQNSGVFDKVADWGAAQLASLAMSGDALRRAVLTFIGTIGISDLGDLGGLWERAKRILTEPVDRLIDFAKGLASGILKFIKDAILQPLAKLAEGTRGWDLLIAVLGKNPITGEAVPRNAETLIGGFLKLIGQDEVFENMKKSGAIPRAWAWFQSAMAALSGFVSQIPDLFLAALQALTIEDVVLVAGAFQKVAAVFGGFLGRFIDWAGTAVWNLLEIVFDVISPGAFAYVKKTGAALKAILKDPMPFVGNLVQAAKLGFMNFGANIGTHLKAGLIDWLTGSLPGVYIPKAFELGEIVKFVFSVLGITWANIRAKLVKAIGETAVKAMEVGFDVVMTLVRDGPAAAWEKVKEQLANLKDMVIGGITDFVVDMVVQKAIPKLVAMFIPGAGFISAIVSIYDSIMVFVNRIATIIQVVKGFIDSIVAIAGGEIAGAAAKVESILASLLSLAINFFAGFVGLGKVADKIMAVIAKIRAPIDKALDALVGWIVMMGKKLFAKVFGKKDKAGPAGAEDVLPNVTVPFQMHGESHQLSTQAGPAGPRIRMASARADYLRLLIDSAQKALSKRAGKSENDKNLAARLDALSSELHTIEEDWVAAPHQGRVEGEALRAAMTARMTEIAQLLSAIGAAFGLTDLEHLTHPSRYVDHLIAANRYALLPKYSVGKRAWFFPSGYRTNVDTWIGAQKAGSGRAGFWQDAVDKKFYPNTVEATIDHITPVAAHWNRESGNDEAQSDRGDWYNRTDNFQLATRENNRSEGARGEANMVPEVGIKFTGPDE